MIPIPTKGRMLAIDFGAREIRVVEFVPNTRPVQVTNAAATERPSGALNGSGAYPALSSISSSRLRTAPALPPDAIENRDAMMSMFQQPVRPLVLSM